MLYQLSYGTRPTCLLYKKAFRGCKDNQLFEKPQFLIKKSNQFVRFSLFTIPLDPVNLVLDFGNTRIKGAFFEKNELVNSFVFATVNDLLTNIDTLLKASKVMICSVTSAHEPVVTALEPHMITKVFQKDTRIPLRNLYNSAITLGSDRLAAAVGAYAEFPQQNILVIDVGTCIKYNFISRSAEYLGGAISPGIPMRLKAMGTHTHALPTLDITAATVQLIGTTTNESLLSGAILGAACEADGFIDRYREQYPDLVVVLTGGDAPLLADRLKNRFFASPFVLLKGIHTILEYAT